MHHEAIRNVQNTGSALRPANDQALIDLRRACNTLRQLDVIQRRTADNRCPPTSVVKNPSASHPLQQEPPVLSWNAEAGSRSVQRPGESSSGHAVPRDLRAAAGDLHKQATSTIIKATRRLVPIANRVAPSTASTSRPPSAIAKAIKEATILTARYINHDADSGMAETATLVAEAAEAAEAAEIVARGQALQQAAAEPCSPANRDNAGHSSSPHTHPVEAGALQDSQAMSARIDDIENFLYGLSALPTEVRNRARAAEVCLEHAKKAASIDNNLAVLRRVRTTTQLAQSARAHAIIAEAQYNQAASIAQQVKENTQKPVQSADLDTICRALQAATQAAMVADKAAQEAESMRWAQ